MQVKVNDYITDIEFANNPDLVLVLNEYYKASFKNLIRVVRTTDKQEQYDGIDVKLFFSDCKDPTFIDEKIRRKDYGDILLEEYSNWQDKTPGWLEKRKRTHFLNFVWVFDNKCLLLPYQLVRQAYLTHKTKWLEQFKRKFADNGSYQTSNIPVPIRELYDAIWRVSWGDF